MDGGFRVVDCPADTEGQEAYEAKDRHGEFSTKPGVTALSIGLIDGNSFTKECITEALVAAHTDAALRSFATVESCLAAQNPDFDIIIYHSHAGDLSGPDVSRQVLAVRQALPTIPLVILSDTAAAQHPDTIRHILKCGANGIIDTRTTGLTAAGAAIRFVRAGGTHAPLDQLLSAKSGRVPVRSDGSSTSHLTPRQKAVMSHLQQGKANKIIAFELGMSESTTKVHVRNIMRKLGATNRTQAAYKAHKLWNGTELAQASVL